MKRALWAAAVLAMLAVDWVALHDMLKGEREVWQEKTFLAASALLLLALQARRRRRANL